MTKRVVYQHIKPNGELPNWPAHTPFRCVVIVEAEIWSGWRTPVSEWMVNAGCLYMMAWGQECSRWDDAVDDASLERFNFGDIPEDQRVMTTWHDDEPLDQVFRFANELANHPTVALSDTVLLHIAPNASEAELLAAFESAKE